jgi:hypothetical protein
LVGQEVDQVVQLVDLDVGWLEQEDVWQISGGDETEKVCDNLLVLERVGELDSVGARQSLGIAKHVPFVQLTLNTDNQKHVRGRKDMTAVDVEDVVVRRNERKIAIGPLCQFRGSRFRRHGRGQRRRRGSR